MTSREIKRVAAERERVQERRRSNDSLSRFCELVSVPEIKIVGHAKISERRCSKKLRYGLFDAMLITRQIAQVVYQAIPTNCSEQERKWRELALIVTVEASVNYVEDDYYCLHKYGSKLAVVLWMAGAKELYYQLCECLETFANPPKLPKQGSERKPRKRKTQE